MVKVADFLRRSVVVAPDASNPSLLNVPSAASSVHRWFCGGGGGGIAGIFHDRSAARLYFTSELAAEAETLPLCFIKSSTVHVADACTVTMGEEVVPPAPIAL